MVIEQDELFRAFPLLFSLPLIRLDQVLDEGLADHLQGHWLLSDHAAEVVLQLLHLQCSPRALQLQAAQAGLLPYFRADLIDPVEVVLRQLLVLLR